MTSSEQDASSTVGAIKTHRLAGPSTNLPFAPDPPLPLATTDISNFHCCVHTPPIPSSLSQPPPLTLISPKDKTPLDLLPQESGLQGQTYLVFGHLSHPPSPASGTFPLLCSRSLTLTLSPALVLVTGPNSGPSPALRPVTSPNSLITYFPFWEYFQYFSLYKVLPPSI